MARDEIAWLTILRAAGASPENAARLAPAFAHTIHHDTFSLGDAELDDFIGQVAHESAGFARLEENLNYTTAGQICRTWPSRFLTVAAAQPFVRRPEALANKVYGGRLGNDQPGDGWLYRGRGFIQVTGRANYAALAGKLGVDIVADPDLLLEPVLALHASILWWEGNVPDAFIGSIPRTTRAVNGGEHGLADRTARTDAAREELA